MLSRSGNTAQIAPQNKNGRMSGLGARTAPMAAPAIACENKDGIASTEFGVR
jgi:hypothetical protein